jgi:hypothetical protein
VRWAKREGPLEARKIPRLDTVGRSDRWAVGSGIHTKVKDHEWQMMDAFIGYPDRQLGEQIESISIYYR